MDKEQLDAQLKSLIKSNLVHLSFKPDEMSKVVEHLSSDIMNLLLEEMK